MADQTALRYGGICERRCDWRDVKVGGEEALSSSL